MRKGVKTSSDSFSDFSKKIKKYTIIMKIYKHSKLLHYYQVVKNGIYTRR